MRRNLISRWLGQLPLPDGLVDLVPGLEDTDDHRRGRRVLPFLPDGGHKGKSDHCGKNTERELGHESPIHISGRNHRPSGRDRWVILTHGRRRVPEDRIESLHMGVEGLADGVDGELDAGDGGELAVELPVLGVEGLADGIANDLGAGVQGTGDDVSGHLGAGVEGLANDVSDGVDAADVGELVAEAVVPGVQGLADGVDVGLDLTPLRFSRLQLTQRDGHGRRIAAKVARARRGHDGSRRGAAEGAAAS
jgi:hypothetical protein